MHALPGVLVGIRYRLLSQMQAGHLDVTVIATWDCCDRVSSAGKFVVCVEHRTGCVPPAPVASSTPKETAVTLYAATGEVAMLNALQ